MGIIDIIVDLVTTGTAAITITIAGVVLVISLNIKKFPTVGKVGNWIKGLFKKK